MRSAAPLLLLPLPSLTNSARVTFSDGGNYTISSDYQDANIVVLASTSLTLLSQDTNDNSGYTISAPSSTDDGESAIRIENSFLNAYGGMIVGAPSIGGTGVTITTDKDRDSKSYATFEDGVEIVGGNAGRESTTQGGHAVSVLQMGAEATFNGGKFTPGLGCTLNVCGVQTPDGNALQVLYGKAIIKGGTFNGNIYSLSGDIVIHGCVEYDGERITGVLLDGSKLDVGYVGQENDLEIIYDETVCEEGEKGDDSEPLNGANHLYSTITLITMMSLSVIGGLVFSW